MTDIRMERELLQSEGLDMRLREEFGAVQLYNSVRECHVVADGFFWHIALVNDPSDLIGPEDEVWRTVERIGQQRFGSGFSYNAGCFNTGRLYEGQPLTRRGTHTVNTYFKDWCEVHRGSMKGPRASTGYNLNVNFRALCLPQQVEDPVSDEQVDSSAKWAAAQIRSGLAKRDAIWHGHRCCTAKGCPGQKAYDRIDELQELTEYYTKNGLTMALSDDDLKKIKAIIWEDKLETDGRSARKMLRQASKAGDLVKEIDKLGDAIAVRLTGNNPTATVTPDDVRSVVVDALKQALREGTDD
jgi:hypothetical protein